MSLTPEQWKRLDEAERAHSAAVAAIVEARKRGVHESPHLIEGEDRAGMRLMGVVALHLRDLIDAARPKCETCGGEGAYGCGCGGRDCCKCLDCNGTGWAV